MSSFYQMEPVLLNYKDSVSRKVFKYGEQVLTNNKSNSMYMVNQCLSLF